MIRCLENEHAGPSDPAIQRFTASASHAKWNHRDCHTICTTAECLATWAGSSGNSTKSNSRRAIFNSNQFWQINHPNCSESAKRQYDLYTVSETGCSTTDYGGIAADTKSKRTIAYKQQSASHYVDTDAGKHRRGHDNANVNKYRNAKCWAASRCGHHNRDNGYFEGKRRGHGNKHRNCFDKHPQRKHFNFIVQDGSKHSAIVSHVVRRHDIQSSYTLCYTTWL